MKIAKFFDFLTKFKKGLENGFGNLCQKTALENGIGKRHWKTAMAWRWKIVLEICVGKQHWKMALENGI
jgi:hypothetical protein